ncbi:MAG: hypothetical protein JNL12_19280 [Planctomycetes bacterium]|nr:hypothetical protein [Planctomycetota bacterium]
MRRCPADGVTNGRASVADQHDRAAGIGSSHRPFEHLLGAAGDHGLGAQQRQRLGVVDVRDDVEPIGRVAGGIAKGLGQ